MENIWSTHANLTDYWKILLMALCVMKVVHLEDMIARPGKFQKTSRELSEPTWHALKARGITQLFSHQAQAIDSAMSGGFRMQFIRTSSLIDQLVRGS